jgi:starch phosphorylase
VSHNLRWTWDHDTIELFRRLDDDLWEETGHNPVLMLGTVDQSRLEAAAEDEGFLAHLGRVTEDLDAYLTGRSAWFDRAYDGRERPLVAYLSAEFGLTECLEIFAGGLGVLSGDHLKSASDLGVPLIGIGLLYQEGYFRQRLSKAGWQQEVYEENDFHNLPLTLEVNEDGDPLVCRVTYPERRIAAYVWRAQVGRVPLYLLDTNVADNQAPEDRDLTDELYGGDQEMRIRQEIMLGIGGCRALQALGLEPTVFHLNEGHSAFLALEQIRRTMETNTLSFDEARELVSASLIFTTHTPVSAGHDRFAPDLMRRYFGSYAQELGLSWQAFMALGREDPDDPNAPFCMTTLALHLASHRNGVSRLHGQVSREMWQVLWPGVPEKEIPIGHVTNGVHFRSWISLEMNRLYERYLGPRWREEPADQRRWQRVERIATEELWRTHERRRERLVAFVRRRLRNQWRSHGAPQSVIESADEVLDPEVLTIGFARRFATYKRATLLLRDPERLARLLGDPERPVQVIYAGKAHPLDDDGKALIAEIVKMSHQNPFRRHLVFLEDYGMDVARHLVQGADVWLNTPRRPHEACGTSGMKAAANGVLNLSVLDGWWDEAYQPGIGWAIGRGEQYTDPSYQDQVEADALYDLLERDAIPAFYEKGADGLPRRWIEYVKRSISSLCHYYNSHRMVQEYTESYYLPAASRGKRLAEGGAERAKMLAAWKARVQQSWPQIRIQSVDTGHLESLHVGERTQTRAHIDLSELTPDDVRVEFYVGPVAANRELVEGEATPMDLVGRAERGEFVYESTAISCHQSGMHGYTVRVLPYHPDLLSPVLPGLITWAGSAT